MAGPSPLNLDKRNATDACWGGVYLTLLLATVIIAIYGFANNNRDALIDGPDRGFQCVPTTIVVTSNFTLVKEMEAVSPWLVMTFFLALVMGSVWMCALKTCAKTIVYATLVIKPLLILAVIVYMLYLGAPTSTIILPGIFFAIYVLFIMCWRHKIPLTAALIEQSVCVIQAHPAIFLAAGTLMLMGSVVYAAIITAAAYLVAGGSWTEVEDPSCVDGINYVWSITSMAYAGLIVLATCAAWSWELFMALRFFVISFTTGVWYFNNTAQGGDGLESSLNGAATRNPVSKGFSLAFTKSFGSIAFASLIMTICEQLRRMARQSARNNGIVGILIACCIQCIISWIEFLTRFALTFHAITGDDFCSSARTFTNHLTRHGFSALFVDWLSRFVLSFNALILSLVITAITVVAAWRSLIDRYGTPTTTDENTNVITALIIIGIVAFVISAFILTFIAGILLNVIDASYCCLVLDLDHGSQHQTAMAYTILAVAAPPNYVIQQPNGSLAITQQGVGGSSQAYAQPPQPTHAVAYAQPQAVTYGQPAPMGHPVAYAQPTAPPTAYAQPIVHTYQPDNTYAR